MDNTTNLYNPQPLSVYTFDAAIISVTPRLSHSDYNLDAKSDTFTY